MTAPLRGLLGGPPAVVTVGAAALAESLSEQAVPHTTVDWRPPPPGTEEALASVAADPRRAEANALAVSRMLAATATGHANQSRKERFGVVSIG